MPGTATQVLNTIKAYAPYPPKGKKVLWETTLPDDGPPMSGGFDGVTGSYEGSSILTDLLYTLTASAPLALETAAACPATGPDATPSTRAIVQKLVAAVNGVTAWTTSTSGITGIQLCDGLGLPLLFIPIIGLNALAQFSFPANQQFVPMLATLTSYNSSTGVMTFASGTFSGANSQKGMPFQVVAGTGIGQTGWCSASTTTTVTPAGGAFAIPLDSTSVISFPYFLATGASGTTIVASKATFNPTLPIDNIYYVVIIAGTGAGQIRPIPYNASPSATTITVATWDTTPDTTSVFMVTTSPWLFGAIDFSLATQQDVATLGQGLNLAPVGTMTAGSPIRAQWYGYWSYPAP
jgi:hypothetical protein